MRITLLLLVCVILAGCATPPDKISTAYVSSYKYKNYDCEQITMEMDYVSKRVTTLYQSLDSKASGDSVKMGVGLVLFWPTLFFLDGKGSPEAIEYANLKGDYEALRQAAVEKKCSLANLPPSPEEQIKAAQLAAAELAKQKPGERSVSRGH